jgi:hypothetical protein
MEKKTERAIKVEQRHGKRKRQNRPIKAFSE